MEGPHVVCNGDFHPLNVMVDGDRASVIDWTDAGLGPRQLPCQLYAIGASLFRYVFRYGAVLLPKPPRALVVKREEE